MAKSLSDSGITRALWDSGMAQWINRYWDNGIIQCIVIKICSLGELHRTTKFEVSPVITGPPLEIIL